MLPNVRKLSATEMKTWIARNEKAARLFQAPNALNSPPWTAAPAFPPQFSFNARQNQASVVSLETASFRP
jgi:hypothetical protein